MNRRVVGLVTMVAAVPLAAVGTFLPLYEQVWTFGGSERMELVHTSWTVTTSNGSVFGREALYGVPVVVAAALLVVGAAFVRAAWGRLVAFGGALMLLGATWAVAQFALATLLSKQPTGEGLTIDTSFGDAVPVWVLACLLALVGSLVVQEWPARAPQGEGPVVYQVEDDDSTPPFGIPVVDDGRPAP